MDGCDASKNLMTIAEAARRLGLDGVSKRPDVVIRRMVRRGELIGVRVSKWLMIDPGSVDRVCGGPRK